jgi:hypothetical protein
MKKHHAALAALVLIILTGASAAAAPSEFKVGLTFSPALPRGEFRDVLGRTIWGGELMFAFRPARSPFIIGTRLGFGAYDTDRWDSWLGLTEPDVLVDVRTTNALLTWNVFLRFQPERGWLRPYAEIFAGLHHLTTDTKIGSGDWDDDGHGDFDVNNASDTAFAYGAGAGVLVPVVQFFHRGGRRAGLLELDLGIRYAKGGRADYLVASGVTGVYDTRTSRTDVLTLAAGLTFSF